MPDPAPASRPVQKAAGLSRFNLGYGGPAGLRLFTEIDKLGQQIDQGEIDAAFLKALNSTAGVLFSTPRRKWRARSRALQR